MELKYKIGVQRKIFESFFISNLNQVILHYITRDMTVFVGHVQAVSKYQISYDIQNTTRIFILPDPYQCLKLDMDVNFDFQLV